MNQDKLLQIEEETLSILKSIKYSAQFSMAALVAIAVCLIFKL